jgi:predicted ArsR family transcriptional regulator
MADMPRSRETTHRQIIAACNECEHIVFGHRDISKHLDIGKETTRHRMSEMVENDLLKRRQIGDTYVYWLDCKR